MDDAYIWCQSARKCWAQLGDSSQETSTCWIPPYLLIVHGISRWMTSHYSKMFHSQIFHRDSFPSLTTIPIGNPLLQHRSSRSGTWRRRQNSPLLSSNGCDMGRWSTLKPTLSVTTGASPFPWTCSLRSANTSDSKAPYSPN
jgi:hypothetical protein